jgi:hypothetical protein
LVLLDTGLGGAGVSLMGMGFKRLVNFFKTATFMKKFDATFIDFKAVVNDLQVQQGKVVEYLAIWTLNPLISISTLMSLFIAPTVS